MVAAWKYGRKAKEILPYSKCAVQKIEKPLGLNIIAFWRHTMPSLNHLQVFLLHKPKSIVESNVNITFIEVLTLT